MVPTALPVALAIGAYIGAHIATISWFPFVHSDEAWLASLTRTMLVEQNLAATEDFFALTPRYPHAIKTLFHLLQMPFIAISFSAASVRMLSLAAALVSLWFLYRIAERLGGARWFGVAAVLPLAMDIQFVYASHFARQEILLVAWMLGAVWAALTLGSGRSTRSGSAATTVAAGAVIQGAVPGVIVASAIFVHPNSFIIALAVAPWVIAGPWIAAPSMGAALRQEPDKPRDRWRAPMIRLAAYAAVLALGALLAIGASYAMDAQFVHHYREFGDAVGVSDSPLRRLFRLRDYFEKLWFQRAGTYYLPPIRVQLVLLAGITPIAAAAALLSRSPRNHGVTAGVAQSAGDRLHRAAALPAASILAVVAGLYAIGKYSPPSAVFLMPWLYLMVPLLVGGFFATGSKASTSTVVNGSRIRTIRATTLILTAMIATASVSEILRWRPDAEMGDSYERYLDGVSRAVASAADRAAASGGPSSAASGAEDAGPVRVLANLNTAFAWEPDQLRVYRDLARLPRRTPPAGVEQRVTGSETSDGDAAPPPGAEGKPTWPGALARFLVAEGVTHLVVPVDELELIYTRRPLWNEVYGNPTWFYPELLEIIYHCGERVGEYDAPVYAMRMIHYQGRGTARVRIYRLDLESCGGEIRFGG